MKYIFSILFSLFVFCEIFIIEAHGNTYEVVSQLPEYDVVITRDSKTELTKMYSNSYVTYFKAEDFKGIIFTDKEYLTLEEITLTRDLSGYYRNQTSSYIFRNPNTEIEIKVLSVEKEENQQDDTASNTNKREYDWYYPQESSGIYSRINCGPAVLAMITKWKNEDNDVKVEDIRNEIKPNGGEISTTEIADYLYGVDIDFGYKIYENTETIKDLIDKGNIALIVLNMIPINGVDSGHYMIVHDYIKKDDELYFIVQDPYNHEKRVTDGYVGKNKEYKANVIDKGIRKWWKYVISIPN